MSRASWDFPACPVVAQPRGCSPGEFHVGQLGAFEQGVLEIGVLQLCLAENGSSQVGSFESRTAKVGTQARVTRAVVVAFESRGDSLALIDRLLEASSATGSSSSAPYEFDELAQVLAHVRSCLRHLPSD
jgi:hypothetical protein